MDLPLWKPRERDSAEKRNEVIHAVNSHLPVLAGVGVEATSNSGGGGTVINVRTDPRGRVVPVLGKVVAAGPNAEADYSDYRYWVQLLKNRVDATSHVDGGELDLTEIAAADYNGGEPPIVTAYNANEFVTGGHAIAADTYVCLVPVTSDAPKGGASVVPRARWFIAGVPASLPSPQYQFMLFQGVAGNQGGYDWFRGSPPV